MLRTKKEKKKKEFDGEFDITPMIDVVLLLLIFFMVSTRMAPESRMVLPKAKHGEFASLHDAVVLVVKKSGTDVAMVFTANGKKLSDDPDAQSAEITEYVMAELQEKGKKSVLIQGEPSVLSSEIVRVQQAVNPAIDQEQPIMIAVEH